MTTLAETQILHRANEQLVRTARQTLSSQLPAVLAGGRSLDAVATRQALMELLPAIVDTYGEASAMAAAEWYEGQHQRYGSGPYSAVLADTTSIDQIEGTVRYASGFAADDRHDAIENILRNSLQRHISGASRGTIIRNSLRDSSSSGWYRIARPTACDFCVLLAARGAVYRRETADFAAHDDCGCRCAPSWDPSAPEVGVRQYEASDRRERSVPERRERNNTRLRTWMENHQGEIDAMRAEL